MAVLSDEELSAALTDIEWVRDGDVLTKTVKGKDFVAALTFVNAVGARAEAANHHPDIDIRWNTVVLRLSTHSEGGITEKDVDLATEIDALSI